MLCYAVQVKHFQEPEDQQAEAAAPAKEGTTAAAAATAAATVSAAAAAAAAAAPAAVTTRPLEKPEDEKYTVGGGGEEGWGCFLVTRGGGAPTGWPHTAQSGKPDCRGPEAEPHQRDTPITPIPGGVRLASNCRDTVCDCWHVSVHP
jgi:hypothetical protein